MGNKNHPHKRINKWKMSFIVVGLGVFLLILYLATYLIAGSIWLQQDNKKAIMQTAGPYTATLESLNNHSVPDWYKDAKFGVFLHWGLFSVPAYAPVGEYKTVLQKNYDKAMIVSPYAEDYWNAIKDPSTPTAQYHAQKYNNVPYQDFKKEFEKGLKDWDARAWAKEFKKYGAKYIIVTAKYHDGFALWPTKVKNPHQPNWHTDRDVLGELAEAVRAEGMKFGIYYSGGVDWTFQPKVVRTLGDYSFLYHGDEYADYADAQMRELIDRYKPDILWNDISWPTGKNRLFALFADYYNTVPEGVVNDRWQTASETTKLMGTDIIRSGMDLLIKLAIANDPVFIENITPPVVPHSDFTTPEYTQYNSVQQKKWETTRGIGNSYGFNRNEADKDYASFETTLFPDFIDAVSKNGNLLLNIGPDGGAGKIPPLQDARMQKFGTWLNANGQAIYGTSPWSKVETVTSDGQQVRFTMDDKNIYAIIMGDINTDRITLKDIKLTKDPKILNNKTGVTAHIEGKDTVLSFSSPLTDFSPVIQFSK